MLFHGSATGSAFLAALLLVVTSSVSGLTYGMTDPREYAAPTPTDPQSVAVTDAPIQAASASRDTPQVGPAWTIWPFPESIMVSGYGPREAPCEGCSTFHRGIDFDAGYGTAIPSASPGVVTAVGWDDALGYRVEVSDPADVTYIYAHMIAGSNPATIKVGAQVGRAQTLGLVGNTGMTSGPHLHLGVKVHGELVDPYEFLLENSR